MLDMKNLLKIFRFRPTQILEVLILCGAVWLSGCGGAGTQLPPAQLAAQVHALEQKKPSQEKLLARMNQATLTGYRDYAVGPEDLLVVNFFGIEDLNREVRVNGQGEISLPLVGPVKVGGLSPQAIEKRLAHLYIEGDYIKAPQISVEVKEYRHQRVMVTGAVATPGSYEVIGPRTLLEMLGKAGGLTDKAGEMVHVIRAQSASDVRKTYKGEGLRSFAPGSDTMVVDLKRLVDQGDMGLNLPIKNGDVIFVPYAQNAYVLGAVTTPKNVPVKDNLTATQAVAMAGGQHILLSSNRLTVLRLDDQGKPVTLHLDLSKVTSGQEPDILLKGNDIVYVQESGLRRFLFDFRSLMPGSYSVGSSAAF